MKTALHNTTDYRSATILVKDHCSQGLISFGIVLTALKMMDRPNTLPQGCNLKSVDDWDEVDGMMMMGGG